MNAPAPYCAACNRLHLPDQCRRGGECALNLFAWFSLLLASVLIGVALGALSVGVW
ncbi:hypothetical protein I5G80_gp092 [Mycobacterium phage Krueger]|uniref:Uncharacterized protein n=1 Tax=Mycobacterium phage Krueger TaxID=2015820 RepID=A0A222ZLB5_9CAUD|nr:hypothetical protein I5G80_gp092 [Mycobacterium phage Krueger]ASR85554.1 hypothetical protein SEA_KRUEGER_54 [Mycobacterium phage Krueger]